jgi:hypothetical protein
MNYRTQTLYGVWPASLFIPNDVAVIAPADVGATVDFFKKEGKKRANGK